jgi:hypothetical protein
LIGLDFQRPGRPRVSGKYSISTGGVWLRVSRRRSGVHAGAGIAFIGYIPECGVFVVIPF